MMRPGSSATNGHRRPVLAGRDLVTVPTTRPEERAHDAVHDLLRHLGQDGPPHEDRPYQAVRDLLRHVGEDPEREGLRDTPQRVVAALEELTSGYSVDVAHVLATTFSDLHAHDEPVLVQGIRFWSLCEHHLLPFHGTAAVAYVPNGRIVGLSKIARTVHAFARRLQLQERMTEQIADAFVRHLDARGVAVHIEATHLCMAMRGVQTSATTVTRAFRGSMKDESARARFLHEVNVGARHP